NIACLTADVACAILPGATGGGLAVKAIERGVNTYGNTGSYVAKYGSDTAEALAKISKDVESKGIAGQNARVTGTLKHSEFKNLVSKWSEENKGSVIRTEQSIDTLGNFVDGNPLGSVRPDVIEIGKDNIVKIYDLKTGNAQMNNKWMNTVEQRLMDTGKYDGVEFYRVKNGETVKIR
ncbi:hypothetical protein HNP92_002025, partial [Methanococcus maripaludis]